MTLQSGKSVKMRARTIRTTLSLMCMAVAGLCPAAFGQAFLHPGCLEAPADFARMNTKLAIGQSPWTLSYNKMVADTFHNNLSYTPHPSQWLVRGTGGQVAPCNVENFNNAAQDAAAAYQMSLRWKINGDTAAAAKGVSILNAWASTLVGVCGDPNAALVAIQQYQFACAGENLRDYSGWAPADFTAFKNMLLNIFYPMNHDFLTRHDGTCPTYMWAPWDTMQMCSMIAIGVVCDDRAKYNEAINYFKSGIGNGQIDRAVPFVYNNGTLGQGQEEGRDQGHSSLDVVQEGVFCTIAYNQGDDLFGWENNKVLAMCEYFADYNLGNSVPFTTYTSCLPVTETVISSDSRGANRPGWDLIYNQYYSRMNVNAPFTKQYCARVSPEGTDAGDQLGLTTLTHTIDHVPFANGSYGLQSHDGNYLDNLGATTDGALVGQWASGSSTNQKWTLTYLNNGYYKITCATGGKCLDDLGHTADGSQIGQWTSGASFNQQWMIVPMNGGWYKVINRGTGRCLDNAGLTANGSILQQWGSNLSVNQQWEIWPGH